MSTEHDAQRPRIDWRWFAAAAAVVAGVSIVMDTHSGNAAPPAAAQHAPATYAAQDAPTVAPAGTYSENGTYAVNQASGGLDRVIPAGRYRLTVTPGRAGVGSFMRCNSVLCGLSNIDHAIKIENAVGADYTSVVDIAPTDTAVWMQGVTLTRVE